MKKKSLYQYIAPNILAMVGMSCYILADTFFIATSQGTNGITALNLALPIYGLIFAIGSMIGTGSAIRYTLAKATDQQEAKNIFQCTYMGCDCQCDIYSSRTVFPRAGYASDGC